MKVTYWSDFACPYCYVGEIRLHKAIESLGLADDVEVEMKAFELYPDAPRQVQGPTLDRFARKYRLTRAAARQRIDSISAMGRAEGIDFNYATTLNANMREAQSMGVSAVPFFVVDDKYVVSGCRPTQEMARVLTNARDAALAEATAEGGVCGPDGCAI